MASSSIASSSTAFINKEDVGLSAFSSQHSVSVQTAKKRVSKKKVSVMTSKQTERKPATTGSVKTGMTMTEKILAKASGKPEVSPGDNIWVNVDVLMIHDVSGPGAFGIFKKEFGQNAKVWDPEKLVVILTGGA
ncbi:3-isopropylmalate dehydratase large subunit, chloroplastic-like [Nicotiana tomentosiformis]|uniref:3-isopropylmalate dehydratase large subunit, chloroplastic-like n=1 Tax=Nicotiana tomentosiformis TaxID=4098 RepID=UPI00388CBF0C